MDRLYQTIEEIEPYPVNGSERKAEWEENEVFWDELVEYYDEMMGGRTTRIQCNPAFVGLFSTVVLWKGDRSLE